MPAIVADDALGLPGRAGGVENVERVGGLHRHAVDGVRRLDRRLPVEVALGQHRRLELRPLQHDAVAWLVGRLLDRGVEQRLVGDGPAALDAAARRDDHDGLGVVDAGRQLVGGEAAEHYRVDGADAGAGQHRHQRFRHHRHVDDDPVALAHAVLHQGAGEPGDEALQLDVADLADAAGDGAVVDDRRLLAAAGRNVAIDGIEAGVEHAAGEPARRGLGAVVEHLGSGPVPLQRRGGFAPETLGIGKRPRVYRAVDPHLHPPVAFGGDDTSGRVPDNAAR